MYEKFGKVFNSVYFIKNVDSRHFMKKFQGFGVSYRVLLELKEKGVRYIIHSYRKANGEKELWMSTVNRFIESQKRHSFNNSDPQRFVSTKDMVQIEPEDIGGN